MRLASGPGARRGPAVPRAGRCPDGAITRPAGRTVGTGWPRWAACTRSPEPPLDGLAEALLRPPAGQQEAPPDQRAGGGRPPGAAAHPEHHLPGSQVLDHLVAEPALLQMAFQRLVAPAPDRFGHVPAVAADHPPLGVAAFARIDGLGPDPQAGAQRDRARRRQLQVRAAQAEPPKHSANDQQQRAGAPGAAARRFRGRRMRPSWSRQAGGTSKRRDRQ
jgi:hypothetical protein